MASQLEALTGEITLDAQREAAKIIEAAEAETKRLLNEAEAESKTEASEITKSAKNEAEAVKRKLLSEAQHKARLARLASRNTLVDEILKLARKKIADTLAVKDTRQRLISYMLSEAVKEFPGDAVKIRLNKATSSKIDLRRLEVEMSKIAPRIKTEWQTNEDVEENGIVIESPDGKIRVVNSIPTRMERLEREILVEIRRRLFAE